MSPLKPALSLSTMDARAGKAPELAQLAGSVPVSCTRDSAAPGESHAESCVSVDRDACMWEHVHVCVLAYWLW